MSAPILQLSLSQRPVFLLNSRQGRFSAAPQGSGGLPLHPAGPSFSRSYGVILPSSLTRVLPIALVCSTCPPVSVCGTGTQRLARGFSWQCGLGHFWALGPAFTPQAPGTDLPIPLNALQAWHLNPVTGWPTLLRHPLAQTPLAWYGNINPLSIAYAFRPRLRPD